MANNEKRPFRIIKSNKEDQVIPSSESIHMAHDQLANAMGEIGEFHPNFSDVMELARIKEEIKSKLKGIQDEAKIRSKLTAKRSNLKP